MAAPVVTVLARASCRDGPLRAALDAAGVPYRHVRLDGVGCGYTSPAVRVDGVYGGPETLIEPSPDRLVRWLADLGVAPPRGL